MPGWVDSMEGAWKQTAADLLVKAGRGVFVAGRQSVQWLRAAGLLVLDAFWRDEPTDPQPPPMAPAVPSDWTTVPLIEQMQRERLYGSRAQRYQDFVEYAINRWGGKLPRTGLQVLCLGTGGPTPLERSVRRVIPESRVVVVDTRPDRIERARETGLRDVEYRCIDLRKEDFPTGPFHLVASHEFLHRIAELECLFDQIVNVLDPIGQFVALEYLGPNRLQYTDRQVGLVNALLALLPEGLRRDTTGEVRDLQERPPLGYMIEHAPDRAVRSEDLLGVMRAKLKLIDYVPLGGTLLAPLLAGIAHNFAGADAEAERILPVLIETESRLIEAGLLGCDYGFAVGRKPLRVT